MVALLDFASVATASTVSRSYPCCCNIRRVTANNSDSRSVHCVAGACGETSCDEAVEAGDTENLSIAGNHGHLPVGLALQSTVPYGTVQVLGTAKDSRLTARRAPVVERL